MSICDELQDLSDRQLLARVLRTATALLENVDQYVDDQHKENGSAEYALVPSTYYFTLRMFNVDRSTISYRLMEKVVECDPTRIKDVCLFIDRQPTQHNNNNASNDDTASRRKPIVLEISIFYASTPTSLVSSLMDRFDFKHYRETIVKEIFEEAWQNYRNNVDDFQRLIYLPETFPKVDSKKLEELAYVIINMEKVMPITETTLMRDPLQKTRHYSLIFQNIQRLSYSFIEFLFDKFESVLQDVRFEYHGNSNTHINTTSLLVELLIVDPAAAIRQQKKLDGDIGGGSSPSLEREPLKRRQRSSSSFSVSKTPKTISEPMRQSTIDAPPPPQMYNTKRLRDEDADQDVSSRLFQPPAPLYSSAYTVNNKRHRQ